MLILGMGDKKKKAQMFVKLVSAAGTGFFYVKRKPRQFTEKLEFRKVEENIGNLEVMKEGTGVEWASRRIL
ncbi:hypothetical protein Ahy_B04g071762 [Arachis hypogaea]|uniref:50S ribosomal protein L33, chloroplastic n=1 Tax=Arachis hypogaea TaxID=3818 RepID=A0A444ZLG9_ARAHY|nr:hypothetical protein Ahy_B04g071762 [Arachis hypogaea]